MSHSEVLLAAATVGGFALLLATVGAFVVSRQLLGVLLLVAAGAAFAVALVAMGRVSQQQEDALRAAVLAKYDVRVQAWGAPLGSSPAWRVDGRTADCEVDVADESDPVLECDGKELPRRR